MWEILLLVSIIASPLFVMIEGRRARKLEKQKRFIRIERAVFIGLFIMLALFMLTGVLGFFDFVSRFKEPVDKIVLFSPAMISVITSIVIADIMREEVESRQNEPPKAFLLASGVVFLLALAFVIIPTQGKTIFVTKGAVEHLERG
ncbi:hypothetical protein [Pyrococcus kukulkanii]|uniref:DUF1616 domain-containing protein n=1 Tax=Pyrococcus kukulkanii TaxID=1609559 RepID=A0ABV4T1D6_9EURY